MVYWSDKFSLLVYKDGYTKRRLLVGEQVCVCQSGVSNSTSGDFGLVLSTVA